MAMTSHWPAPSAGGRRCFCRADFTCKQICGPALQVAAAALSQTGLTPGRDYSLVVVGIDARGQPCGCAGLHVRPGRRSRRIRAQRHR